MVNWSGVFLELFDVIIRDGLCRLFNRYLRIVGLL